MTADITLYRFPSPTSAEDSEVRKMYDSLRVKKRFDSLTPEEQDWLDWAENYFDREGW